MYCSNCGKKLPDDAKFCSKCGTPMNSTQRTPYSSFHTPKFDILSNIDFRIVKDRALIFICLLIPLLLLSSSWSVVFGDSKYDVSAFRSEIASALDEVEEYAQLAGAELDLGDFAGNNSGLLKGRLSPLDLGTICKTLISMLDQAKDFMDFFDGPSSEFDSIIIISYAYIIVLVLSFVMGLLALVTCPFGLRFRFDKLFLVLQITLLFVFSFCCIWLYQELEFCMRPTLLAIISVILSFYSVIRRNHTHYSYSNE